MTLTNTRRGAVSLALLALAGLSLSAWAAKPHKAKPVQAKPVQAASLLKDGTTPKIGDTAPNFTLKTPAGVSVSLASILQQGSVVLVMLRGYPATSARTAPGRWAK